MPYYLDSAAAEAAARFRNFRAVMALAFSALRYNSVLFSATFFNMVRSEGDELIAAVKLRDGTTIEVEKIDK